MNNRSLNLQLFYLILVHAKQFLAKLWFLSILCAGLTLASVAFGQDTLFIEKISCEGNSKSNCDFIQNQISIKEGDLVDDEKIRESRLRLQLLGHFTEVDIRLSKGSQPGKVVATVSVIEQSSYSLDISSGIAQPHKPLDLSADIIGSDRNFSGRGDTLSLRLRSQTKPIDKKSIGVFTNTIRLEYVRPNFLLPRMYAVTGVGGNYLRVGGSYFTKSIWGDLSLGYKVFDYSFVALGYRYRVDGYSWGTSSRIQNPFVQMGWDSQDNPTFPTQGSRLLVGFDWHNYQNGSRYKHHYFHFNGSYLQHLSLSDKDVLSLRFGSFRGNDHGFYVSEDQATSLRYTRISKRVKDTEIRKAAYYFEPGRFYGYDKPMYGARLGTTLQTDFGVVNLFLLGGIQ